LCEEEIITKEEYDERNEEFEEKQMRQETTVKENLDFSWNLVPNLYSLIFSLNC
jgi:hypothetical protein